MAHFNNHRQITCQICGKPFRLVEVMPVEMVRESLQAVIRRAHPEWTGQGYICLSDLNRFRDQWFTETLKQDRGELSELEQEVLQSLKGGELLSENIQEEIERALTLGERVADRMAEFGGSWTFLIGFAVVMIAWITVNSYFLLKKPFDPFPYILLNLALSCLAAIQAPVILMSQNREAARDRLRSEHDYQVNLKAELEIRHLNAKMDLLLTRQWQRLLDIQEMQTDLMQEMRSVLPANHKRSEPSPTNED